MLFFEVNGTPGDLHSFPTRRSSDLIPLGTMAGGLVVDRLGAISTQYIYGVTLLLAAVYYLGVVRHKAKK